MYTAAPTGSSVPPRAAASVEAALGVRVSLSYP
jgi:hypothetical protein